MSRPRYAQMMDHALDFLKGWPHESGLDKKAKLSANVSASRLPVYNGSVVHLNEDLEFELGAKGAQMPIFLFNSSDDLDVSNVGGPSPDVGDGWVAVAPDGVMSGLVANGPFELQTTEFEQTASYAPNDKLHAPTEDEISGSDKTRAGLLHKLATWPGGSNAAPAVGTNNICGIVSDGKLINCHRRTVLQFWPVYVPGTGA